MPLYIGIDAGGTKTEAQAQLHAEGEVVRTWSHTSKGIQARRLPAREVVARVVELVEKVQSNVPEAELGGVVAGIAGAADLADTLTALLQERLGTPHARIVHDGELALEAAFGEGPGLVVVAGTGSVVLARTPDGRVHRRGGWGYRLGDEGSGYALGRAALRAVGAALDGGPDTMLRTHLADQFGITTRKDLLQRVYDADWPLSEAAPLVLQAAPSDAVAAAILDDQTAALASLVQHLRAAYPALPPTAVLFGGLSQAAIYVDTLRQALKALHEAWTLQAASLRPVAGALQWAKRLG